jgi:hypothetical protein
MSSSTSSQWIPTPLPMRRQLARWAGEAFSSRGNHSSGAETQRASASVTTSASSVKATSTASATGLLAKMLIPSNNKRFAVLLNQIVQVTEFGTPKATRLRKLNGSDPEFCVALGLLDVNVARLHALPAEKEKAVSVNSQHLWHEHTLSGERSCARLLSNAGKAPVPEPTAAESCLAAYPAKCC